MEIDSLDRAEIARRYGRAAAYAEESEESTDFWLKLLALALVLSLFVLLASYTLAQVTSRDAARRILGKAIPEITDFDHAFATHYDELQAAASTPAGRSGVALPVFPIKASLLPNEVTGRTLSQVRQVLLRHSADAVYEQGSNAFSANGRPVKLGRFAILSAPWTFNAALGVLNPRFHRQATSIAKVALAVATLLALLLIPLSRDYNRVVMYGAGLLIAAVPLLAVSALAWLVVQLIFGTSADPLIAGTSDLTRAVAWYAVLSYLVYCGLAVALIVLGLLFERIIDVAATAADPARRRQYRV